MENVWANGLKIIPKMDNSSFVQNYIRIQTLGLQKNCASLQSFTNTINILDTTMDIHLQYVQIDPIWLRQK